MADETLQTVVEETGNILRALVATGIVLVVFIVVGVVLLRKVLPGLQKRLDGEKHRYVLILLKGFRRPLSFYCKMAGGICVLYTFVTLFPIELLAPILQRIFAWLPDFLITLLRIITVISMAWGLVASSGITSLVLRGAQGKLDINMSKSVTRFLSAVFNVIIIAIAVVLILHELEYDINGLVAGLGLGGLTIALAAQKSAANFFGGLIIVLEKPFEIGDWISCSDVEGTVEDINLRSTKVRTSGGAVTIVPNATLSDTALTNWTATMKRRRASFTLPLVYGTKRKRVSRFADAVRTMLETDPEILPDGLLVRMSDIGASGLNLLVVFNTSLPGYADHMRIKERVNFAVLEMAENMDVRFAHPTTTVQIEDARPE